MLAAPTQGGLLDLVRQVIRHPGLILGVSSVVVVALLWTSVNQPPSYRSHAKILLADERDSSDLLDEFFAGAVSSKAVAEVQIIRSRTIADVVLSELPSAIREEGSNWFCQLDDLDRHWPLNELLSRWTGVDAHGSQLEVEVLQAGPQLVNASLEIEFEQDGSVAFRRGAGWNGRPLKRLEAPQPEIEILGSRLRLHMYGDLRGRSFRFVCRDRDQAIGALLNSLSVIEVERGSGVLELTYSDTDPTRCKEHLDAFIRAYLAQSTRRSSRQAHSAAEFLEQELARIRSESAEAERTLIDFQNQNEAALLTETARHFVHRATELDLKVEQNRIRQFNLREVQRLIREHGLDIKDLAGMGELDLASLNMIETMVEKMAREAGLAELFTDDWPELVKVRSQIDSVRQTIEANLESRLEGLALESKQFTELADSYRERIRGLPSTERNLARYQRRVDSLDQIHTYLLKELEHARVAQAAALSATHVIDWASRPTSRAAPNLRFNLTVAAFLGLACGLLAALTLEILKRRVHNLNDLELVAAAPALAQIPRERRLLQLRRLENDPRTREFADALRGLRAQVCRLAIEGDRKSLAFVSADPKAGRSLLSCGLAISLARSGYRTLLIDADFESPKIHEYLDVEPGAGLVPILSGKIAWREAVQAVESSCLDVLAGSLDRKPAGDLLGTARVDELLAEWRGLYDLILVDLPPEQRSADLLQLAPRLDGLLAIAVSGRTPSQKLAASLHHLRAGGATVVGAILNGTRPRFRAAPAGASTRRRRSENAPVA